jgi:hypothetical protein
MRLKRNKKNNPCGHPLKGEKLGYVAHLNWMDEQEKKGLEQVQCQACKLWLFPCEREAPRSPSKRAIQGYWGSALMGY